MAQVRDRSQFGCPRCHSFAIHRSKVHGIGEHVKKIFTKTRPFRCVNCQWRGWIDGVNYPSSSLNEGPLDSDLRDIDRPNAADR